jgi:hypothetical protein
VNVLTPISLLLLASVQAAAVEDEAQAEEEFVTSSYERAVEVGMQQCLQTTKELSEFVLDGHAHGSHDMWGTEAPNDRPFDSLIVKEYSDGDSHISMTIMPREGACDWSYTETYVVEQSCSVIREEWFGDMKYTGALRDISVALHNDEGLNVYLTPVVAGEMCLVTKREVYIQSEQP